MRTAASAAERDSGRRTHAEGEAGLEAIADGRNSGAAGWHLCLDVMALSLDGQPIGAIRGGEAVDLGWQGLHNAYADRLGIATDD